MDCQSIWNTCSKVVVLSCIFSFLVSSSQYFWQSSLILWLQMWLSCLYSSKLPCNQTPWHWLIIWIVTLDIYGCLVVLCWSLITSLAVPVMASLKCWQSSAFSSDMALNLFLMLELFIAWICRSCRWDISSHISCPAEWSTLSFILILVISSWWSVLPNWAQEPLHDQKPY